LVLQEFRLAGFHLAETFYCVSQTGACTRGSRYRICYLVTEGFLRRELSYGLSFSDAYGIGYYNNGGNYPGNYPNGNGRNYPNNGNRNNDWWRRIPWPN